MSILADDETTGFTTTIYFRGYDSVAKFKLYYGITSSECPLHEDLESEYLLQSSIIVAVVLRSRNIETGSYGSREEERIAVQST